MASSLPSPAANASRNALNNAMAEGDRASNGEVNGKDDGGLEDGEIQEIDMENQAEGIKTVFSDPKNFNVKHPLYTPWTLWFDSPATKGRNLPQTPVSATPLPQTPNASGAAAGWMEDIKKVITFDSVEEFWGLYNNIAPPSQLGSKANYYLFKEGIIPAWEDAANNNGGKWSVQLPRDKTRSTVDTKWLNTMLSAIGEIYDPDLTTADDKNEAHPVSLITGVILSARPQFYRISIWTRLAPGADDQALTDRTTAIGKHFKTSVLGQQLDDKMATNSLATEVEFISHKDGEKKGKAAQNVRKITV